jgi:hypothetical protein
VSFRPETTIGINCVVQARDILDSLDIGRRLRTAAVLLAVAALLASDAPVLAQSDVAPPLPLSIGERDAVAGSVRLLSITDDVFANENRLAQTQPAEPPATQPAPSKPKTSPPKKTPAKPAPPKPEPELPEPDDLAQSDLDRPPSFGALSLASVPNMIGDFYGISAARVTAPLPIVITSTSPAGFVTNLNGGFGADQNPAVPIQIFDTQGGTLIVMSIGNGLDTNGDMLPDSYPIGQPTSGVPSVPIPGTVTYTDGTADFAGTGSPVDNPDGWQTTTNFLFTPATGDDGVIVLLPPIGGAATRRVKLSENGSPQPRNRVFFNYNYFNDVIAGLGDVNRYSLGVESTYWNGIGSFELRLPVAATMSNTQVVEAIGGRETELGNLSLFWKHVLYQTDRGLISGGCGVGAPTARDARLILRDGTELLRIENQAVHLQPFIAAMSAPTERFFWQTFVQFDLDLNGNTTYGDLLGQDLRRLGVIQDANLLFVDVSTGYRIYENPYACLVRNAYAIAELHYSTTLQDEDSISANGFLIEGFTRRFDVLNTTLGVDFRLRDRINVRPAMTIPLRTNDDRHFDYEASVQVNMFY